MSYNEGQKKLQISRENLNPESGDWRWSKLGRMTKSEAEVVLPKNNFIKIIFYILLKEKFTL